MNIAVSQKNDKLSVELNAQEALEWAKTILQLLPEHLRVSLIQDLLLQTDCLVAEYFQFRRDTKTK